MNNIYIASLIELVKTQPGFAHLTAALEKMGQDNDAAINALLELIANSQDKDIRLLATESLGKIAQGNQTAINALVELIGNSPSKRTQKRAAKSLEKIDPGNNFAAATLVKLTVNKATGEKKIKPPKPQVKSRSSILVSQKPGFLKKPGFLTGSLVLGISLLSLWDAPI